MPSLNNGDSLNSQGGRKISWIVLNQSQSQVFTAMIERLARQIGPCLLIAGSPLQVNSSLVNLTQGPVYKRSGKCSRVFSWLRFLSFAASKTVLMNGRPFLLVTTNPPFLAQLALFLFYLKGWSFGVLVWDIYPEHLVSSGILGKRNLAIRAWHAVNRTTLQRASLIVTLSNRMADVVEANSPVLRGRVAVVPNFADATQIVPLPKTKNPFAADHGLVGKTVVLYSGNMGATHGLECTVSAAGLLANRKDICFVFIGDGFGKAAMVQHATRLGLKNVIFLPMQPEERLRYSLPVGDIAIVSQSPGSEHLSLPSKTYSFLAAGCAILAITDQSGDLASLVTENAIGEVINGDPVNIADCLTRLIDDGEELAAMRRRSRELAVTTFDVGVVERRWEELLKPLTTT